VSQWPKLKLIARSAFNGLVLWTLDFPTWEQVTVYIKRHHAQMQRRLVAIGDAVYCTPGLTAALTALDAATGRTVKHYKGTEDTQEFVYHEGQLFVVIGNRMRTDSYGGSSGATKQRNKGKAKRSAQAAKTPDSGVAFKHDGFPLSAYNPRTPNAVKPICVIVAIEATTGMEAWRTGKIAHYVGCTMALKGDRLVYQTANGLFCLNARSGAQIWEVEKAIPYGTGSSPNSLVQRLPIVLSIAFRRVIGIPGQAGQPVGVVVPGRAVRKIQRVLRKMVNSRRKLAFRA
jgi:outer membrane protein assembly factor BamB